MAYIRWGSKMPSGGKSRYFVFGDPDGLVNMNVDGGRILYSELVEILNEKDSNLIKKRIGGGLKIGGEELEIVYSGLIEEKERGEWDSVPDFGKRE